jgi:uncharacterized protein YgbK (DUF1537 family)
VSVPKPLPPDRPILRLLADDLTGALDSAARFVPLTGAVPVIWSGKIPPGSVAVDSGTRDLNPRDAAAAMRRLTGVLEGGDVAFKKIDSLLRGHVEMEFDACRVGFDTCVLAPAFPFQGRITRGGRQLVRDGDGWRDVGGNLPLLDAETDADLDAIVARNRTAPGRVLWIGTAGLAGALTERRPVPCPPLTGPVLALVGSDHSVTAGQLATAGPLHHRLPGPLPLLPAAITLDLPLHTERDAATQAIAAAFAALLSDLPRPGTLVVTGGATLRSLCEAIGATGLLVDGEVEPGVPTAILRGGAWDGLRIVSKSGAFGDAGLLVRLLRL